MWACSATREVWQSVHFSTQAGVASTRAVVIIDAHFLQDAIRLQEARNLFPRQLEDKNPGQPALTLRVHTA